MLPQHVTRWLRAAAIAGMTAGWVMLRFLMKLVGPADEPLRESDGRVIGAVGTISMAIREGGGTGEIIFPLGGSRRCSGARPAPRAAVAAGLPEVSRIQAA